MTAYQAGSAYGAVDLGSISQTSGQSNCTVIGPVNASMLHKATTSASTGYICLPTAYAGKIVYIANATGHNLDLYSNATSYTPGTADTINGTAGTTAFTGLTSSNAYATCISPVNGAWYCSATSNGGTNPGSFSSLTVSGPFTSTYGTTTIASGACGATTNGSVSGTNLSGLITIGSASTSTCTVSFSATLATAPNACTITPASTGAAAWGTTGAYVSAITTGHFVITGTLASTLYYYLCI